MGPRALEGLGALGPDDKISGIVKAVSFDDILREIGKVIEEGLSEGQTIPVGSIHEYEVIAEFGWTVGANRTTQVGTKYKTVDRKVRPVVDPLPEDSWERMKAVADYPSLRDPIGIGHRFTNKTL